MYLISSIKLKILNYELGSITVSLSLSDISPYLQNIVEVVIEISNTDIKHEWMWMTLVYILFEWHIFHIFTVFLYCVNCKLNIKFDNGGPLR